MDFNVLSEKWCALSVNAEVVVVTDGGQYRLAEDIAGDIPNKCRIINFDDGGNFMTELQSMHPCDLIIALFSFDAFLQKGANRFFSPFDKPEGVNAKYVFIRLGISKESLLQGLATPKELLYDKISEMHAHKKRSKLRVTNASGTDITLSINGFSTCEHEIKADGGMAFLPPSETSTEVRKGKAEGKIAVDVTVGQLYYFKELLGNFGLIAEPVILTVKKGSVTDISGGKMAAELREKLFALPDECRELVELGQGLSKMSPTGLIGVDESITPHPNSRQFLSVFLP